MIEIRKLIFEDIDAIVEIEKSSYPDPWSRNIFEKELTLDFSHFFVGTLLNTVVTYACFWQIEDEAQLANIAVSENHRRKGIGKEMLKYIIDFAKSLKLKKMFLEVRGNNFPALELYKKFGFGKIGVRKKYYSNSVDAIVMEKIL